jgi:hypothetical protein
MGVFLDIWRLLIFGRLLILVDIWSLIGSFLGRLAHEFGIIFYLRMYDRLD